MVFPACLAFILPILVGIFIGFDFLTGLLLSILVSGLTLAIALSNSGGAFDNAKKYIEGGGLGNNLRKGSNPHKASVIGDTLGDPLKDTSGPSLNILVKLSCVTSLTLANCFSKNGIISAIIWEGSEKDAAVAAPAGGK